MSVTKTRRIKRPDVQIRSFLDSSLLSEESQKLKAFLQAMHSGEDTCEAIKSAEDFFLEPENKLKIKMDDISWLCLNFRSIFAWRF